MVTVPVWASVRGASWETGIPLCSHPLLLSFHVLHSPHPGCVSGCLPTRELAFAKTRTDLVPAGHQPIMESLTLLN